MESRVSMKSRSTTVIDMLSIGKYNEIRISLDWKKETARALWLIEWISSIAPSYFFFQKKHPPDGRPRAVTLTAPLEVVRIRTVIRIEVKFVNIAVE